MARLLCAEIHRPKQAHIHSSDTPDLAGLIIRLDQHYRTARRQGRACLAADLRLVLRILRGMFLATRVWL
jgi:hypothetical protein